ncbi:MAG: hypothetical protein ACI4RA_11545 [Kiritimatiellia bacterium]
MRVIASVKRGLLLFAWGAVLCAAGLLTGCATGAMKGSPFDTCARADYKGDVKDRVNLWPLAYWRDPVGSVAWPLVALSDDLFAVRPVYSQYRQTGAEGAYDEFNLLWPIAQADTKSNDYRVFPVFWGWNGQGDKGYQTVFPLYWNGPEYNIFLPFWIYWSYADDGSFRTLGGLAGINYEGPDYHSSWCFPLWYENSKGLLATPIFGYGYGCQWLFPFWIYASGVGDAWALSTLGGLAGMSRKGADYRSSWCFPLWYENSEGVFATPLLGHGPESNWFFPFWIYSSDADDAWSLYTLGGLAGVKQTAADDYANWCIPFWYQDEERFISLPFSYRRGRGGEYMRWKVPGLLSWGETEYRSSAGRILLGLGGWRFTTPYGNDRLFREWWVWPLGGWNGGEVSERDRSAWLLSGLAVWKGRYYSHVIPLYFWDRGCLFTPFGGWSRNLIWITPFVSIFREANSEEGGWVFPICFHRKSRDYDEVRWPIDRPTLPESLKVASYARTNDQQQVETRLSVGGFSVRDETAWFMLWDNDRHFFGGSSIDGEIDCCHVTERHEVGNSLLFRLSRSHTVAYDLKTRGRMENRDETETQVRLFAWLYSGHFWRDRFKGEVRRRQRVLRKLWDWDERDGGVSLDVFPGFTYDRNKIGATKVSLLWRLFRYETDPEKGTKEIDLLFLPVWR